MRKYFAELFGTFVLVLVGCGSAVFAAASVATIGDSSYHIGIGYLGVSVAFGVSVLVMVYAVGPISGCHINPAVTVAMLVRKKIEALDAAMYILFQCIGALIAAEIILSIALGLPAFEVGEFGLASNGYGMDGSPGGYDLRAGFVAEVAFTFVLLSVIFGATATRAHGKFAGVAIGLTLMLVHLCSIPITNTSVNPARSLGPAAIVAITAGKTLALEQVWLFWLAPIVGALLAAFVSMVLWPDEAEVEEENEEGRATAMAATPPLLPEGVVSTKRGADEKPIG